MVEKVLQLNIERSIFWSLIGALTICAGFYMYFINATVHNVVIRQNLENEASTLQLSINNQEFAYIAKRNSITLALAHSMGFQETTVKTFISKNSKSQVSLVSR